MNRKLLIPLIMLLVFSTVAFGAEQLVSIDGREYLFDVKFIEKVPFVNAEHFKELGLTVKRADEAVILANAEVEIRFVLESNQVQVNDLALTLAERAFTQEEKTYVPLSFVLETINYQVSFDGTHITALSNPEVVYPLKTQEGYVIGEDVKSVISLAPGVTEKLFALGVGDRIKGRTTYCNYPAEVGNIPLVGTLDEPDLELMLSLEPDAVIAETHFKEEILKQLKAAGIMTIARKSPEDVSGIYSYMLDLGMLFNKNYEARALVASMKSKAARTEYILQDIPLEDRPTAYYVVGTGQWGEYTAGRDTFISRLIALAGAVNVADDVEGWSYSLERLIEHDPDYIFGNDFNLDTMLANDNYRVLSALTGKNYLVIDQDVIERAAPRALDEGLRVLVGLFHPDRVDRLGF
ncbi:MAG: helical backbone metal receptor [Limnochordia bacterium]|nr:helical backbone metal receptor [Limnochordia bacterium]